MTKIPYLLATLNIVALSSCSRDFAQPSDQNCFPNDYRCNNDRLDICDGEGKNWLLYENCRASNMVCVDSNCQLPESSYVDGGNAVSDAGSPNIPVQDDAGGGTPKDAGNSLYDASMPRDSGVRTDAGTFIDAGLLRNDGGRTVILDAGFPKIDGGVSRDAGTFVNPNCYSNDFNSGEQLDDLVIQSGQWSINPEGFLQLRTEDEGEWKVTYVNDQNRDNLEATVNMRMFDSINPTAGVSSNHSGLLFRYTPESNNGYLLQLEHSNRDTVEFSLDDFGNNRLQSVTLDCGEIGCGYRQWYTLNVVAVGNQITASLNGEEKFTIVDNEHQTGKIGFAGYAMRESNFKYLEVCPP